MFKCNFCDKSFNNINALNGHQNSHSNNKRPKGLKYNVKNSRTILTSNCLTCSSLFSYKEFHKSGKFCCRACEVKFRNNERNKSNIKLIENLQYVDKRTLKNYLIEVNGNHCSICNINTWNNKKIVLQIDHIDGNSKNNILTNVRLLCPNCHSQTETWGKKKKHRSANVE